jgi:hypothetical protein
MWMSAAGVKVVSLQSREKADILVSWLSSALEVITKMVIGNFSKKLDCQLFYGKSRDC